MKLSELVRTGALESLNEWHDVEITGVYISDMVSDIMSGAKAGNVLLTLQTHKSVVAAANLVDVPAIIFVRGRRPDAEMVALATKAGMSMFCSEADSWTLATKMFAAGVI